jgi:hypothetical protein
MHPDGERLAFDAELVGFGERLAVAMRRSRATER